MGSDRNNSGRVRVWDLPVRVFHWGLAGSFVTAWLTLDNRYQDIHVFAGYLMAGLILFRLLWGFVGGPYARFRDFSFGWQAVRGYLKGIWNRRPPRYLGHNPAGSWAIYVMLGLGLTIAVTGLLAMGGEERQGPLAGWLDYPQGELAHSAHEWLAWLMLGLVGLHLAGVVVESLLHRENLVAAMLTGFKPAEGGEPSAPVHRKVGAALLITATVAGLSWFQGHLLETTEQPYRPFLGPALPDNALWREECGGCHLAYHPSLLPARSWQAMMQGQTDHFGDDLALDEATVDEIEIFLVENAAEQLLTEAAWKISRSIPQAEVPLRITETPYWIEKHAEVSEAVWDSPLVKGRGNCAACHLDAQEGTFEDAAMRLPEGVDNTGASE